MSDLFLFNAYSVATLKKLVTKWYMQFTKNYKCKYKQTQNHLVTKHDRGQRKATFFEYLVIVAECNKI